MKLTSSLLTLLSLLLLSSPAPAETNLPGAAKKPPPPPDYFPLSKDYWWKYENTSTSGKSGYTLKVVSADKQPDDSIIYDVHTAPMTVSPIAMAGFSEKYTKPKGWVLILSSTNGKSGETLEYANPRKLIENPLKEYDTWNWSGKKWGGIPCEEDNKVEAVEDVSVPAGNFKAVRVTTKVVQGGMPVTKTCWYAAWVGPVKYQTESAGTISNMELVDYSFKKPENEK